MHNFTLRHPGRTGLIFTVSLFGWAVGCSGGNGGNGGAPGDAGSNHCSMSVQCADGQICHLGICETGSLGDASGAGDSDTTAVCSCTGRQTCDAAGACQSADICTNDGDCVAPLLCIGGGCAAGECHTDADCTGGRHCYTAYSACGMTNCAGTADCPAALACDTGSTLCVQCLSNPDCPGTQICLGGACEEGANCATDTDCRAGHVCASSVCADPACGNESSEPNDDFARAQQAGPGTFSFFLSGTDSDIVFVPMLAGDGLLARATYNDDFDFITGELSEADETWITTIEGTDGSVVLSTTDVTGNGAYIEIYVDTGACVTANLTIEIFPGGACFNDAHEPNNTAAAATPIPDDPAALQRRIELCPDDVDWYRVTIAAGKTLTVTAAATDGSPPLAEAHSGDGATLLLRDSSANPSKTLVLDNTGGTAPATYLVSFAATDTDPLGAQATVTFDSQ